MGLLSKAQKMKLPSPGERENMIYFAELHGRPVPLEALADECEECEGHGTEVCPDCEGEKEQSCHCSRCGDDHWTKCETCSGKGDVGPCKPCNGTGIVLPKDDKIFSVPEGVLTLPFEAPQPKPKKKPPKRSQKKRAR